MKIEVRMIEIVAMKTHPVHGMFQNWMEKKYCVETVNGVFVKKEELNHFDAFDLIQVLIHSFVEIADLVMKIRSY